MTTLDTDREFQDAWAAERYASTLLALPGPKKAEARQLWQRRRDTARARMDARRAFLDQREG